MIVALIYSAANWFPGKEKKEESGQKGL